MSQCLDLVRDFYKDKKAERSQVPLINHIHQGVMILKEIGADQDAIDGFCLHPLFQKDSDLMMHYIFPDHLETFPVSAVVLAMEYRHVANRWLLDSGAPPHGTKLSPLGAVREMLIADKVQNRKDFELYHLGTHPRSNEYIVYFNTWLDTLGITEKRYQELKTLITDKTFGWNSNGRCTHMNPCCDRRGEYNGFGSDGPTLFQCDVPNGCSCHD